MLITESSAAWGPKWIINFPTKKHWRNPSRMEWIKEGLNDLVIQIIKFRIGSIALPPLGCGNGGLEWAEVRELIVEALNPLTSVDVQVFEPTHVYQNTPKRAITQKLTPARALLAEMVRRYGVLGFECSLLEVQKLAWFLDRGLGAGSQTNPLRLNFVAGLYGPYADGLRHVLDGIDGSYLRSEKRIADASRHDIVSFDYTKTGDLGSYLDQGSMQKYVDAVDWTQRMIEGFEAPFGMELLATVDWLVHKEKLPATVEGLRGGIQNCSHGMESAARKERLFDERVLSIALERVLAAKHFHRLQRTLSFE